MDIKLSVLKNNNTNQSELRIKVIFIFYSSIQWVLQTDFQSTYVFAYLSPSITDSFLGKFFFESII